MPENLMGDAASNSAGPANANATDLLSGTGAPPADAAKPPADAGKPADKPEGAKDEQSKPADKPEGAPEKYELKAPEGETLDPNFTSSYESVAKELNLTQAQAQGLIEKIGPVLQSRQMENLNALKTQWAEESRSDKEFGGDKLNETLATAKSALERFGTPKFRELVTASGLGNHPELIRFLRAVGVATSDDQIKGGHRPDNAGRSAASVLYPNQGKTKK